ncbi:hypothetical protein ACH9EU_08650 [Kocuria sp. M1R5S2]|uniref:hypothetical protein n=1 Tax=Kocuria rhizosphaerae TaxID=3376285 RepID=UPI003799C636
MLDRAQYEATSIDWPKLNRYAARVAQETKLPPEPPITKVERVEKDVPVEKRTGGFFGLGAKTYITIDRKTVEETIRVVGPHWVINKAMSAVRERTRTQQGTEIEETEYTTHTLVLCTDGSLAKVQHRKTEVWAFPRSGACNHNEENEYSVLPIDETDVVTMDYSRRSRDNDRPTAPRSSWARGERGNRLLRHAKGVGINLALKDLLEGRTTRNA